MYHSVLNENVAASFHTAEAIHKIMKQMCHEQFCFHSHLSVMMYMGSIWAPAVIVKQCRTGLRKLIPSELLNKFPLQVSEIQKKLVTVTFRKLECVVTLMLYLTFNKYMLY